MFTIVIEGRLTTNPTAFKSKCGKSYVRFTLANNRYYFKQKEIINEVSFFKVIASEALAERLHACLKKGSLVLVCGNIRSFIKQKCYVRVWATNVKLLSNRR